MFVAIQLIVQMYT